MTSGNLTALALASGGYGPLDAGRIATFVERGYLVLPSFLSESCSAALEAEVDRWVDDGLRARAIDCCRDAGKNDLPPLMELELVEHGKLIAHPALMAMLQQLMGPGFVFHHLHSARHDPGCPDKPWHHDYEQPLQGGRSHLMIHVFHYLRGLNGTIGDLVFLPGSQRMVADKDHLQHLGVASQSGEVVLEDLPRGSSIIVNSAVFHARRSKPGGAGQARYFIDISYCQGGARWPAAKPYWREMLRRARALGLDGGQWPELFSEHHFDEYTRPGDVRP